MTPSFEITCIHKQDRNNIHERITHVGGLGGGKRWKITQQAAISYIKSGEYKFFVNVRGDRVDVIVATSRWGNEYIKTTSDGDEPNNLLSLAECPL